MYLAESLSLCKKTVIRVKDGPTHYLTGLYLFLVECTLSV